VTRKLLRRRDNLISLKRKKKIWDAADVQQEEGVVQLVPGYRADAKIMDRAVPVGVIN
jgi:hypothetical protein